MDNQARLELIRRLAARCISDTHRPAVHVVDGLRHFAELIVVSSEFMVELVEQLDKKNEKWKE